MLVICEECAKKYNVDEHQMKGVKARFTCPKCGHPILVRREDSEPTPHHGNTVLADNPRL